jgi:GNAT superfamily N-acetyltransferase
MKLKQGNAGKMVKKSAVEIRPFQPHDQEPVRDLILAGLEEYWGTLDESKNPDLQDIADSYRDGIFLVACLEQQIVCTGALLPRSAETAEIVRMSVARHLRRQGLGRQMLAELCSRAYRRGFRQVILETTATWKNAIAFYQAFGFQISHFADCDVYFTLDLRKYHSRVPVLRVRCRTTT